MRDLIVMSIIHPALCLKHVENMPEAFICLALSSIIDRVKYVLLTVTVQNIFKTFLLKKAGLVCHIHFADVVPGPCCSCKLSLYISLFSRTFISLASYVQKHSVSQSLLQPVFSFCACQ